FFSFSADHRDLHSFPTRRSSDLEGKMFKPMALTFSFALIGAMVLCFTYVPVAASLFLKPTNTTKRNISVRIMAFLNRFYEPTIRDRKSTRLNSSRVKSSYAVFCL